MGGENQDVGSKDFMFGATIMVAVAILAIIIAILS